MSISKNNQNQILAEEKFDSSQKILISKIDNLKEQIELLNLSCSKLTIDDPKDLFHVNSSSFNGAQENTYTREEDLDSDDASSDNDFQIQRSFDKVRGSRGSEYKNEN